MRVLLEQIINVSIWGVLPVFLAFIIFLCAIMIKCTKKEVLHPLDDILNKKKFHKTEKIFSKIDYFSEIYLFICITLAIISFIAVLDVKYELYIYQMINNIGVVSSIVIGLTAIAITMAVVIILFDKRYYIVFSIREVLQKYKFAEWLFIVIVSCIIVSITTLTLLNGKIDSVFDVIRFLIFEIAVIYNVISVTYIMCVIVIIMFFDQKSELSLLRQLYRWFWFDRVDTLQFNTERKWNKEVVDVNIEYLLKHYLNICNCDKIGALKSIEFVTTMDCYKKKWYNKAKCKFDILLISLFFVSALIDWMVLKENCRYIIIINILVTIIAIIFAYSNIQSVRLVIMRFFSDTWGYYFISNENKEFFVPRVSIMSDIYSGYIKSTNSINAFFYIWLSYIDKGNGVIENEYNEVVSYLYDNLEKKSMVTFLPAFTIGFFMYERNIKNEKLKEIYNEIIVSDNKRFCFEKMMDSQIFYLTINYDKVLYCYRDKLNEYFKWINSC